MTRAPLTFKLNNKLVTTYWMQSSAYPSETLAMLEEYIAALKHPLLETSNLTKQDLTKVISQFAEKNGLNQDPSWANYYYQIDFNTETHNLTIKIWDYVMSTKHKDSGTINELLAMKIFKDATRYELLNNQLQIFKGQEVIGNYDNYTKLNANTDFFSYSAPKKGKLIDKIVKKI